MPHIDAIPPLRKALIWLTFSLAGWALIWAIVTALMALVAG